MWEKANSFVRSCPIIVSVMLGAFFIVALTSITMVFLSLGIVDAIDNADPAFILFLTILKIALSCLTIWLMRKMHLFNTNDFRFKNMGKGFLLGWYNLLWTAGAVFFMVAMIPEGSLITPDPAHLTITILFPFLGTALFEELVFRGLILKILLVAMGNTKKGIINACILSAVIFGVVHYINLIRGDDVLVLTVNVIAAIIFGLSYAALFLRTKTLWIPILLHGLMNLSVQISNAFVYVEAAQYPAEPNILGSLIPLIFALPLVIVALVLLKKVTPDDVKLLMGTHTK